MNRQAQRDPRPGRPSAEEIKKTTQPINQTLDTSSQRKGIKRPVDDLGGKPRGPKDMG
jgi:hypothetical protein